ncbi:MAG: hypothetical protein A2268_03695 [Candidatus Raymondbacteria bacterium RifOxyA12_full_50_37]|uniref:Transposase IS200-like domain-containing protein n=1 Tax=Candidatus Raymondbacteria bacterium RIFOXYD12_FULL_49_13 TaxID=1817890 RepID=A0A1F7F4R5_UNCRA|nr:MAG: hypothetical protein A2268_03695 [Candidatus Raymondbacteria bacterium RifOxyA12_full_50_37]OGJ91897.1 MAG: hypothetical protein A2248_04765 [Candidatus Raymondbacteria bacterium RIFOXYA2_FULL_49_16]OGJ91938.1 MAG: hypothetical protein A2350_10350 [Candidatus Raymondbacteria bacterium RifOxyB12_full_50_8]OGJ96011.1 MAG: hypothetical protein A2487_01595 [Candidatus Raymondbacteria bacterium RifOxyC12_full_50_8]OGJ98065.1 MAG: hypothetical protein A2453_12255 [Candidatus Raymondbacteria b
MRMPRIKYPNAIYHIYNQGVNRGTVLFDNEDNEYFLWLLNSLRKEYHVKVFCFVTMINHYHCLLRTIEPNISDVMQRLGYYFVKFINNKYRRVGPLFRNRFQSQLVESEDYLRNVIAYIHNNPLVAGLISEIHDRNEAVFTSFHDLVGLTADFPWIDKQDLGALLQLPVESEQFRQLLWRPIAKESFYDITMIERINQRIRQRQGQRPLVAA